MVKKIVLGTVITFISTVAVADNFMDAAWAKKACAAWNTNATLTGDLAGDAWISNNKDRGYKIIQMYRTACGETTKVQLTIEDKDGKATCTYGGIPDGKKLDFSADYVMNASDKNWDRLGTGKDGPMKAMMFGRLKFKGPKGEAMSVMKPFGAFLKLAGSVPGEKGDENCPVVEQK